MDTGDDSLAAHLARGHDLPSARLVGGNQIELLEGGDQLFPSMLDAMARARSEEAVANARLQQRRQEIGELQRALGEGEAR